MREGKITFTLFLYNQKKEEALGIELDEIEAQSIVKVDEVCMVRECVMGDEDNISKDRCRVELKTGDTFLVKGSYEDTVRTLEQHGW